MTQKEEFLARCLVLDTETNSNDYNVAEIIEAGFVIKENNDWTIYQELHKPVKLPIPPKVSSITYITNKMVEDKPTFIDSKDVFIDIISGYTNGYLVAHNYFYDMQVLMNHGVETLPTQWLCTWRMSKKLFNGIDSIEETNLPYLRYALELDVPEEMVAHRAGNDSYMTAKLLEVLVDLLEDSNVIDTELPYGPQLQAWLAKPIIYDRMPFGKHKGELMIDVPKSYWSWAMKSTDWFNPDAATYDPDLAASIEVALG